MSIESAREKLRDMHRDKHVVLTEEELVALRAWCLPDIQERGLTAYSCDDCSRRFTCPFVFDPYNTDGDCIASK